MVVHTYNPTYLQVEQKDFQFEASLDDLGILYFKNQKGLEM